MHAAFDRISPAIDQQTSFMQISFYFFSSSRTHSAKTTQNAVLLSFAVQPIDLIWTLQGINELLSRGR